MLNTQWKVETTEEKSGSLIIGLAFGKIHFIHEKTSEKMIVSYRCLSLGLGAGAPKSLGYSESKTTDPIGLFSGPIHKMSLSFYLSIQNTGYDCRRKITNLNQ